MSVNPLYNALGGGANIGQMLQMIKSNPMALLGKRFNLPQGIATDPNSIIQHLVQTGQISQERVNAAYQQAQRMGLK